MFRLANVATPLTAVGCDTVPLRVPPPRSVNVTVVLVIGLLRESVTSTVTAGENVVPAVVEGGASCVIWITLGVAGAIVNGAAAVEVKVVPAADAVSV